MANKAELWDQLAEAIKILDQLYLYAAENTPSFLSDLLVLEADYKGNHIANTAAALKSFRTSISNLLASSSPLDFLVVELAKIGYDSINTSLLPALDDIIAGMDTATETVRFRDWTHGAATAGGVNVGSGILYRCVTDKWDEEIESGYEGAGIIKALVKLDFNLGRTSGTEQALLHGAGEVKQDEIELGDATNTQLTLTAQRAQDGILTNPSFESANGVALATYDGWTITTDAAHFQRDSTTYFRMPPGATTAYALEFLDNDVITQMKSGMASYIDATRPLFLIVRYYRKANCDGTFTIRLGTQTASIVLATVANATWHEIYIPLADDVWYDTFKENIASTGIRISLALTGRTTGTLLTDDIILSQPAKFDGKYYLLTAGQTDWMKDDYVTFTDTVANTGRIQYWIARFYGKSLPHAAAGETYADAT